MTRVVRHPNGPRLYVLGCRLHHGAAGCALVAAGAAARSLVLLATGAALMASDAHDFPWPLRDPNWPMARHLLPAAAGRLRA